MLRSSGCLRPHSTASQNISNFTIYKVNSVTPANNKVLVTVADKDGNLTTNEYTSFYRMDVVPYIVKVNTSLSKLKNNNWSVYNRTSRGHYPVYMKADGNTIDGNASEIVSIYGFNLNGAKYTPYGSAAITLTESEDSGLFNVKTINVSNLKFDQDNVSGMFDLSVNGISSLNNVNNNDSKGSVTNTLNTSNYSEYAYNRMPNDDNNNLLTDDVIFDVWQIDSKAAIPQSGRVQQPVMGINPATGYVGFAYVDGPLYFTMGGGKGEKDTFNTLVYTGDTTYDFWCGGYDFFTSVGYTYDDLGYSYGVAVGGDINSGSASNLKLFSSRWGTGGRGQGGEYDNNSSLRLEQLAQNDGGTYNFNKQRILSPSLATSIASTYKETLTTGTTLAGTITNTNRWQLGANDDTTFGGSAVYLLNANKEKIGTATLSANTTRTGNNRTGYNYYYTLNDLNYTGTPAFVVKQSEAKFNKVITGYGTNLYMAYYDDINGEIRFRSGQTNKTQDTTGNNLGFGNFVDQYTNGTPQNYSTANVNLIAGSTTGQNAGEYVGVGVVPKDIAGTDAKDDIAIVIWYDATSQQLKYTYNVDPITNVRKNTKTYGDTGNGFTTPIAVFDETNIGEYCKIKVDKEGGVHIVAYDSINADLMYAYLPASYHGKATATDNFATCRVDSYGIVGSEITLDIAYDTEFSRYVPFIGYYAKSCVKPMMARLVSSEITDGVIDDEITGSWEITLVPTPSSVPEDHINVGVWKDSDGAITTSLTGTKNQNGERNGLNSNSWGSWFANGTNNPLLGYQIKVGTVGYVEAAQMK